MKKNILAAVSLAVVMIAGSALSAAACGAKASCSSKGASASAAMTTQQATYAVSKVECKDCVTKITSALQKMDGVTTSGWDAKAKAMNVAFVPGKADTKTIAAAITGAGFPAKLVTVGDYSGALCTPEMCKAMGAASCAAHGSQCTGATKASKKAKTSSAGTSSM